MANSRNSRRIAKKTNGAHLDLKDSLNIFHLERFEAVSEEIEEERRQCLAEIERQPDWLQRAYDQYEAEIDLHLADSGYKPKTWEEMRSLYPWSDL